MKTFIYLSGLSVFFGVYGIYTDIFKYISNTCLLCFLEFKALGLLFMQNRDGGCSLRHQKYVLHSLQVPLLRCPSREQTHFLSQPPALFPTGSANPPRLSNFKIKCLFKQAGCTAFSTCSNGERLFSKTPLSGHVAHLLIPRSLSFPRTSKTLLKAFRRTRKADETH